MEGSFFTTDSVYERDIELPDGATHTLHFKELSVVELRRYQIAEQSADPDTRDKAVAHLISRGVVNPDGTQAMTYEQACKLKPAPANAMISKIMEVNSMAVAAAKKPSPPEA